MKEYIQDKINALKRERPLREGFRIKYQFKNPVFSFWEEDAWGRLGRKWTVTGIKELDDETERLLGAFVGNITEDFYNIRNTWAKRRTWTQAQIRKFLHWLEDTRWPHR